MKYFAWQAGVISLALSVIADDIRSNAMRGGEALSAMFVLWASGTLLSSPVPVYFMLKPLDRRSQYIAGALIGVVALVMWLVVKYMIK